MTKIKKQSFRYILVGMHWNKQDIEYIFAMKQYIILITVCSANKDTISQQLIKFQYFISRYFEIVNNIESLRVQR